MKTEILKVELFPNPFLVGEIIFRASQAPKEPTFKIELSDEARTERVRQQLKEESERER